MLFERLPDRIVNETVLRLALNHTPSLLSEVKHLFINIVSAYFARLESSSSLQPTFSFPPQPTQHRIKRDKRPRPPYAGATVYYALRSVFIRQGPNRVGEVQDVTSVFRLRNSKIWPDFVCKMCDLSARFFGDIRINDVSQL